MGESMSFYDMVTKKEHRLSRKQISSLLPDLLRPKINPKTLDVKFDTSNLFAVIASTWEKADDKLINQLRKQKKLDAYALAWFLKSFRNFLSHRGCEVTNINFSISFVSYTLLTFKIATFECSDDNSDEIDDILMELIGKNFSKAPDLKDLCEKINSENAKLLAKAQSIKDQIERGVIVKSEKIFDPFPEKDKVFLDYPAIANYALYYDYGFWSNLNLDGSDFEVYCYRYLYSCIFCPYRIDKFPSKSNFFNCSHITQKILARAAFLAYPEL